jgi:hypothetical protein
MEIPRDAGNQPASVTLEIKDLLKGLLQPPSTPTSGTQASTLPANAAAPVPGKVVVDAPVRAAFQVPSHLSTVV